ncbi:hypothetical protein WDW37_20790 [Bdellovibrionota bacterium FG-1]
MRFTVAWAHVISENLALKIALGCLSLVLVGLSITVVSLSTRKPLLIERACFSRAIAIASGERSPSEIEVFVREAVAMRFDSMAQVKPGFLSADEERYRGQEQLDLKKHDLSERILVNAVEIHGEKITVDSDRLFSVGAVRSALPFPLTLTLGSVGRSEGNPYGLILLQSAAQVPPPNQPQGGGGK